MVARVLAALALACVCVAAGCQQKSKLYCARHTDDLANCPQSDAAIDAPPPCTADNMCATNHCFMAQDTGEGTCVQCTKDLDCTGFGVKNLCDLTSHTCQGCIHHSDCATQACLPDGTCGDDASVIYVDGGGTDSGDCTQLAKCKTLAYAAMKLTTMRRTIKLSGAVVNPANLVLTSINATIIADPGTTLSGGDPVLLIKTSTLKVFDLEIACGGNVAGASPQMTSTMYLERVTIDGCGKPGVDAKGGYLSVAHSKIENNPGGGLQTDPNTSFSITNTFIQRNGKPDAGFGGVNLGAGTAGSNRFELNTVVDNIGKSGAAGPAAGVTCSITNYMTAPNNLIARNTDTAGVYNNTYGTCGFSQSMVVADTAALKFKNDATAPDYDYHLTAGSSAIDTAPGMTSISDDYDGQTRPLGAGYDYGADEYKP